MRSIGTVLLVTALVLAVSAEFASVPLRIFQELNNESLKTDPLFGWSLNRELSTDASFLRTCAPNRIFSGSQLSNGAALTRTLRNITNHTKIFITATVFLLNGWNANDSVLVRVNNVQVAAVAINKKKTSKICSQGDYKFDLRVGVPSNTTDVQISFADNNTNTSLTWGLRNLRIQALNEGSKRPVWAATYFDDFIFNGSPVHGWFIQTTVNEPTSKCGDAQLLGGPLKFSGIIAKRTYTDLPPHSFVRLSADLYLIDNWQPNDIVSISLNGQGELRVAKKTGKKAADLKNVCGGETVDQVVPLNITARSRAEEVSIQIFDSLKEGSKVASWGLANIRVTLLDNNRKEIISWTENDDKHPARLWEFQRTLSSTDTARCGADSFLGNTNTLHANESIARCFTQLPSGSIIAGSFNGVVFNGTGATVQLITPGQQSAINVTGTNQTTCGTQQGNLVQGNFTITLQSSHLFCFVVVPQGEGSSVGVRNFQLTVTPPCDQSCKSCEKWNECTACPENAETRGKRGVCVCKRGFLEDATYPLECREDPARKLTCKDVPRISKIQELVEERLRDSGYTRNWRVNDADLNATQITKCGNSHILGGAGVFGKGNNSIAKTWKQIPAHFKVIVRAKIYIIDAIFNGATSNVGSVALKVDGKTVKEFTPKGDYAFTNLCGAAGLPEARFTLAGTVEHHAEDLTVSFVGSNFHGAYWGVKDVHIDIIPCAPGCAKCETCQKCQQCDNDFVQKNDACACRAGTQKVRFGPRFVCDENYGCGRNGKYISEYISARTFANESGIQAENWTISPNTTVGNDQVFTCLSAHHAHLKPIVQANNTNNTNSSANVTETKTNDRRQGGQQQRAPFQAVGGPNVLTTGARLSRNLENLPPHYGLRLQASVYGVARNGQVDIGSNIVGRIQARVGDNVVPAKDNREYFGHTQPCYSSNYTIRRVETFWSFLNHTASNATLAFSVDAQNDANWAVNDVRVFLCLCPKECNGCSDARTCTSCKEGYELNRRGRCMMPGNNSQSPRPNRNNRNNRNNANNGTNTAPSAQSA